MRRHRTRHYDERGSATIEAVAGAAAFAAFCSLAYLGGHIALAHQSVQVAAAEAARSASIARTQPAAAQAATAAAQQVLANHQLACVSSHVSVDTSGFTVPVGQPAWVTVTVGCEIDSRAMGVPIGIGSLWVEETLRSPLDTYRLRS